jgi:site-specific DNA-methyltransferase (adenine-specific)
LNDKITKSSGLKKGRKTQEYGVRFNVWDINRGFNKSTKDKIAFEHPAIFPEKLAKDHIISWSNKGDIVFDPFMGSGTTAKMAIETERNFLGFDTSKEYCGIAQKRIEYAYNNVQQRMF